MFNGSNFDRKSQLSGILTEPLNPCVWGLRRPNLKIIFLTGMNDISLFF